MDPHPAPDLKGKTIPVLKFRGRVFCIHYTSNDPLYFSEKMLHRFGSPDGSYGVLYAGEDLFCAFIETLGHQTGQNIVQERDLEIRSVAIIESSRVLHLVDLRGSGLAKLGADARLCAGDYRVSQKWSEAFLHHPDKPDGICYPARHDPSKFSLALFHRCRKSLRVADSAGLSDHPMLSTVLDHYNFGLV
jgi:hypothetical protein